MWFVQLNATRERGKNPDPGPKDRCGMMKHREKRYRTAGGAGQL